MFGSGKAKAEDEVLEISPILAIEDPVKEKDPRKACMNLREELIWKKQAYEKQINQMAQMVGMLEAAFQDADKKLREIGV